MTRGAMHNSGMARTDAESDGIPPSGRLESRWWVLVRPPVIYGTIIAAAVIVAADRDSDFGIFVLTLGTIIMVWVAHVFSEVVAGEHAVSNPPTRFRVVFGHAIAHSAGLLVSAVLPLVFLLLGGLGVLPEQVAYYGSLAVAVLFLAVMGWLTLAHRGNAWPIRLAGAVATALMGGIVVVLKSLVH
jgi:hypothetical protein